VDFLPSGDGHKVKFCSVSASLQDCQCSMLMYLLMISVAIEQLASSVKDTGGCYFVPAFSGLCCPYWQPNARGYAHSNFFLFSCFFCQLYRIDRLTVFREWRWFLLTLWKIPLCSLLSLMSSVHHIRTFSWKLCAV